MNTSFSVDVPPVLIADYASLVSGYDEMWSQKHQIRVSWRNLVTKFNQFGHVELERRQQKMLQILRENGVTYTIYNNSDGYARPWQIDPVPLIITPNEWKILELGLKQRSELLNLILQDIYGEQRMIKEGILPMELVYTHPGFLRECVDTLPKDHFNLVFYAADIVRGANGKPWVIHDRTQAPSGIGYALENRMVMSRVMPDVLAAYQIRKLGGYIQSLRHFLTHISPRKQENPRIVVLTPGPLNETYFEHAYLASQLGYTLVQGDDLIVRDDIVWLKTLNGLERIDVIIRRVDDTFCDPVELREDSKLGVPGLLQAIRKQNVIVCNPLGSGILENPGVMAFLPSLSKYFLQQELILPSVATWWCGQEKEKAYVLQHLDQLIIKRTFKQAQTETIVGYQLNELQRKQLKHAIESRPWEYVGQEHIQFSTVPCLVRRTLEPRYTVLRCLAAATEQGYTVMPGGLTRSAHTKDTFIVSNQAGGSGKDTWVIGTASEESHTPISNKQDVGTLKDESLPSRTAENMFWVGRYLERTLYTARIMRSVLKALNDYRQTPTANEKKATTYLYKTLTHVTMTYPGFVGDGAAARLKHPEAEIYAILTDANKQGGLTYNIQSFSQACFSVRDQLAQDTWRILETMNAQWKTQILNNLYNQVDALSGIDTLITHLMAFSGLNHESMTREHAWLMKELGRKIELSLMLVSNLRSALVPKLEFQTEYMLQEITLATNESLFTYRFRYKTMLSLTYLLELLLADTKNPRSLGYQLEKIQSILEALPAQQQHTFTKEKLLTLKAYALTQSLPSEKTLETKDKYIRDVLDAMLAQISQHISDVSVAIGYRYFNHYQWHSSLNAAVGLNI